MFQKPLHSQAECRKARFGSPSLGRPSR
ncbi:hypothetical protein HZ326_24185, partial [Fusarium oxysporum f. sp. albedinis]